MADYREKKGPSIAKFYLDFTVLSFSNRSSFPNIDFCVTYKKRLREYLAFK